MPDTGPMQSFMRTRTNPPPWWRCECCRYADVIHRPNERGYSLGCLSPKAHYGQAGVAKSCCDFERELGTDDEVESLAPTTFY